MTPVECVGDTGARKNLVKNLLTFHVDGAHKTTTLPKNERHKPTNNCVEKNNNVALKKRQRQHPCTICSRNRLNGLRATWNFIHRKIYTRKLCCRAQACTLALTSSSDITPARTFGYCCDYCQWAHQIIASRQCRTEADRGCETEEGPKKYAFIGTVAQPPQSKPYRNQYRSALITRYWRQLRK